MAERIACLLIVWGGLPVESQHPTSATYVACRECREHNCLPCWPSRGQQVWHQRWIWWICYVQAKKQATRDLPWLRNSGQMSAEFQNRGISGPTKRTCVRPFDFFITLNRNSWFVFLFFISLRGLKPEKRKTNTQMLLFPLLLSSHIFPWQQTGSRSIFIDWI